MKNKPYVKIYDEKNRVTNPIQGSYESPFPNRSARRGKQPRFIGNQKGHALVVKGAMAFHKQVQFIECKDGSTKQIEHYVQKR